MKKLFSLLTVLFLSFNSFAETDDELFHLSLSPLISLKNGTIGEHLYTNVSGSYKQLSRLDWDLENIFYTGGKADFSYKNFLFDFSSLFLIPKDSGRMQDSDWMGITSGFTEKTTYSISENSLSKGFSLSSTFLYDLDIASFFSFRPGVGLEYNYYYFKAQNGYGWYADTNSAWYDDSAIFYDKGQLGSITLERKDFSLWVKINPVFKIRKFMEINPYFQTAALSYFSEVDNHLPVGVSSGGSYYYDSGLCYFNTNRAGLNLKINPLKTFSITAFYSYTFTKLFLSKAYTNSENNEGPYALLSQKSGFSQKIHECGLAFNISFF